MPLPAIHHGPLPRAELTARLVGDQLGGVPLHCSEPAGHGNAALTVIRYAPQRPASLLVLNDMTHLPREPRWTGFPPELRV